MSTRSWLHKEWPKTIVLIEQLKQDEKGNNIFVSVGTGFITEHETFNILITCKHVVFDNEQKTFLPNLFASFNQKDGTLGRRSLETLKKELKIDWFFHKEPNVDLAIMPFGIDQEKDDIKRMGKDLYEKVEEIAEGEEIFFLGFPALGIKMEKNIRPIVRAGIIALIQDDKTFLIDANVFPGNSGSPVFLKPSVMDFQTNTLGQIRPAKFIGIINSYLPYHDVAISPQTKRPRIVFEENSGLANVYSTSFIDDMFSSDEFKKKIEELKPRVAENNKSVENEEKNLPPNRAKLGVPLKAEQKT